MPPGAPVRPQQHQQQMPGSYGTPQMGGLRPVANGIAPQVPPLRRTPFLPPPQRKARTRTEKPSR